MIRKEYTADTDDAISLLAIAAIVYMIYGYNIIWPRLRNLAEAMHTGLPGIA